MLTPIVSTWPQAERVLLQELAPGHTATEVAIRLGRSRQDVELQGAQLGLRFAGELLLPTQARRRQQAQRPQRVGRPASWPADASWPARYAPPVELLNWLNRQNPADPAAQRCLITLRWLLYEVLPAGVLPTTSPEPAPEEVGKLAPLTSRRAFN